MTDDQQLIAEALEAIEELDVTYQPFDQHAKLGEPPWAGVQLKQWEDMHGHDVRLKCYPEFGCQVIDRPLAALVERLADALSVAAVRYRAEGWDQGYEAAARFHEGREKGHWENDRPRKGMRQWIAYPAPANPHRALLDENNETQEN